MKIRHGFSLIELLIVIAILAILIVLALSTVRTNRDKADDAKTKGELARLKIALEDYYSDNNCYPPQELFDNADDCNSAHLAPYLSSMPCDAKTGVPYILETDSTGCEWFKLYATLKASDSDTQALALCDTEGSNLGNYGVSSDNTTISIACGSDPLESPISSSSPTGSPLPDGHNYYYCSGINNCTSFDHTVQSCTPYYIDNPNCDGGPNPCQSTGSCSPL